MVLDFVAGCLGGASGVLVGHPFDTVKVRLQTQDSKKPLYRGTFHCFSRIISQEKLLGLYKGMSSPLASIAVINAIVFGVYGNIMRNLQHPDALSSHFFAGAVAGFLQSFVCSPMELAKTCMQLQGSQGGHTNSGIHQYKSPLQCLRKIKQSEGWGGVFRGLGITVSREIPGFGLYFMSYEWLTTHQLEDPNQQLSTAHMFLAGGASGIISWVTTYPIDVLKTRLQADGISSAQQYSGILDCINKSVKSEGIGVFTRGLTSTVIRAFPTNAATFTVVEYILRWFGKEEDVIHESLSQTESFTEKWHDQSPKWTLELGVRDPGVNFTERWKIETQKHMLELGSLRQNSVLNTPRTIYDFHAYTNTSEKTPDTVTVAAVRGRVETDHRITFHRTCHAEFGGRGAGDCSEKTCTCSMPTVKDTVVPRRLRQNSVRQPLDLLKLGDNVDTHLNSRQSETELSTLQDDCIGSSSAGKDVSGCDEQNINKQSEVKKLYISEELKETVDSRNGTTCAAGEERKQSLADSDGLDVQVPVELKQEW